MKKTALFIQLLNEAILIQWNQITTPLKCKEFDLNLYSAGMMLGVTSSFVEILLSTFYLEYYKSCLLANGKEKNAKTISCWYWSFVCFFTLQTQIIFETLFSFERGGKVVFAWCEDFDFVLDSSQFISTHSIPFRFGKLQRWGTGKMWHSYSNQRKNERTTVTFEKT